MSRAPTPPHGLILRVAKADLRNFGSAQLAVRLFRDSAGKWNVVKNGANVGYVTFIRGQTQDMLPQMPDQIRIRIVDTQRTAGFADLCTT